MELFTHLSGEIVQQSLVPGESVMIVDDLDDAVAMASGLDARIAHALIVVPDPNLKIIGGAQVADILDVR